MLDHEAIYKAYAGTVFSIDDSAGAFDKDGKPVDIDEKLVKLKIAELKSAYDKLQYQRDRKEEYPSIEDQLDDLYHNGIEGWKQKIKAIKDKHPKGG